MKSIVKGAAVLAALTLLFRKKKGSKQEEGLIRGLWRKTPPNPDSADKYGDMG